MIPGRFVSRLVGAALLAVVAVGCGVGPDPARGIVIEIDGDLSGVEAFVLMQPDGSRRRFVVAPEARFDDGGSASHLENHLRSGAPVVVDFVELDDGVMSAIGFRDAG